jgi:hypothetical protein
MRTFSIIFTIFICVFEVCRLSGQIFATNTSGVIFTNKIGRAQAVVVASRLTFDMREEDAKAVLAQNGLGQSLSYGDSFGWLDGFTLTDKCYLTLDIKPKGGLELGGAWTNGLVKAAFIGSNGVDIISITLTNAP